MKEETRFSIDGLGTVETYAPVQLEGEHTGYEVYPVGSSYEHAVEGIGKALLLDAAHPVTPERDTERKPDAVYRGIELHNIQFKPSNPDAFMDGSGAQSRDSGKTRHLYGKPVIVIEEERRRFSWDSDRNTEHIGKIPGLANEWAGAEKFLLNSSLEEWEADLLEGLVRGTAHASYANAPDTVFNTIREYAGDYHRIMPEDEQPRSMLHAIGGVVDAVFHELEDAHLLGINSLEDSFQ